MARFQGSPLGELQRQWAHDLGGLSGIDQRFNDPLKGAAAQAGRNTRRSQERFVGQQTENYDKMFQRFREYTPGNIAPGIGLSQDGHYTIIYL